MVMTQAIGNPAPCQKMVQSLKTMELASMMKTASGCQDANTARESDFRKPIKHNLRSMIPQKVEISACKWM
jgi:hypothetical protein